MTIKESLFSTFKDRKEMGPDKQVHHTYWNIAVKDQEEEVKLKESGAKILAAHQKQIRIHA